MAAEEDKEKRGFSRFFRLNRLNWKNRLNIRLRRGEPLLLCLSVVLVALLNAMVLWKYHERFSLCGKVGYYSLFSNTFRVSGFDAWTLVAMSNGQVCFDMSRHPLLFPLISPLCWCNSWLMEQTGTNFAAVLMAAVNTLCAAGASLALFRLLRYALRLRLPDCFALWGVMFSVAYIMLAVMSPDHFAISLFLLTFTLYRTAMLIRFKKPMNPIEAGVLLFLTAGVTLTNGAKTCLAVLFTAGRKAFSPSRIAAFALAVTALCGVWQWQHTAIEEPQREKARRIERAIERKNPERAAKMRRMAAFRKQQQGQAIDETDGLLRFSDVSTSRWRGVKDNLMGETFLLHDDHLLQDIQRDRPIFVSYRGWFCPLIELIVALMMVCGLWLGRRDRVAQTLMAWLAVDFIIHVGFGFALNEVYIMATHWAFALPVAVAYCVRRSGWFRLFYIVAALMAAHNLRLMIGYFVG